MPEKPYNFIDQKKCSCGVTKMNPVEVEGDTPAGYICSSCRRPYDRHGDAIDLLEKTAVEEQKNEPESPEPVEPFCPLMSTPPDGMTPCIKGLCALWSESTAFYGMPEGNCALLLGAEAQAFMSRGDQAREMGDRGLGGKAG